MADRYWVGGTANWDGAAGTKWSTTSGGVGGSSIPTLNDNVFLNSKPAPTWVASTAYALTNIVSTIAGNGFYYECTTAGTTGASEPSWPIIIGNTVTDGTVVWTCRRSTVSIGVSVAMANFVCTGFTGIINGISGNFDVYGSFTLSPGMAWGGTGLNIAVRATSGSRTITTSGQTLTGNSFSVGPNVASSTTVYALQDAFTSTTSNGLSIQGGTFNTNNYNITLSNTNTNLRSENTNTRTINLGSSLITCGGSNPVVFNPNTNIVFNAGTSTFTCTNAFPNFFGGANGSAGVTFYNVAFTGTFIAIYGINTFNDLTVAGPASAGVTTFNFVNQQTINGTLSTTGTAGNRRVWFRSNTYGISVDLVVNSAPSLTDADFRGLYVRGTAAPISGTRIGNRGECRGITFSTPKTVYWNLAGGGNWSANAWALSAGGGVSTDNFPLPQDTATIVNTGLNTSATITFSTDLPSISAVDMSGRTNAMTISFASVSPTVYGNWTNGSGTAFTGTNILIFSGGTTQTITSAGKAFSCPITVDTYGGTVQLADALNIGSNALTVTNGTFTTAGFAVNIGSLSSSNSNVRTINLGASTVTITNTIFPINLSAVNLAFNAGTSTVAITYNTQGFGTVNLAGVTFYNFNFLNTNSNEYNLTFSGVTSTFNNLSFSFPNGTILAVVFQASHIINGTLTCAGASAIRRVFLNSSVIGTPRTLTVNSISATDCDFRDITLAGAASGASPTRAGDCGGNTGITFPAPKTVYWNLAGAQNWSATGWATSSGGTPAVNNFPLAQDTVVFDNSGAIGTIRINGPWNIGTFDASLRTSSMTIDGTFKLPVVYGDWKSGTGLTWVVDSSLFTFAKNGTQTITSNGVQFGCDLAVNNPFANVQLSDALSLNALRTLTLTAGAFDAVTYNVTTGLFVCNGATGFLRMGSGTWTISGTGFTWLIQSIGALFAGTSTIVLSNTSTSARTFQGGSFYYNKLTIGGATGTSTLTIDGSSTFGELASTKTVAHTIAFFGSNTVTFGKWSVTGTAGNIVTITGTSTTNVIAGPAVTGVDYLAMGTWGFATTSPGEFYAGANSTGTAAAPVFRTAAPAPRTLYWVGGTGNWSDTARWSTSSGGGSGAAIPTSLDAVNFDSLSNATAYTATIDAGVTLARCASFTMAGPLTGNVTFAGSVGIAFHGNVSFAATGITRTYTGAMNWAGNSSYTFTTNGLTLNSGCTVIGIGSTWTFGSAINIGANIVTVTYGAFNTSASNYALTAGVFQSTSNNIRSVTLNGSNLTLSGSTAFSISSTTTTNLTFSAGTSTISLSGNGPVFNGGSQTFNNVSFTSAAATSITITGANTFNTLSFAGRTSVGINAVTFSDNQTISTLTLSAGTASAYRTFLASNTIGTQRTLTVTTLTAGAADIDFRDIAITGAAAPLTGTRFGDAKGNSGITFPAAKTVYWALATNGSWGSATGAGNWSATNGGSADNTQFPLAQDTAFIPFAIPNNNQTITVNANYNIGTLDMNERNGSALVTLATGSNTPSIYGNWINGTGTTLTGTGTMTFAGRGAQTITSAGKTFTQNLTINTPGGSVTLLDAVSLGAGSAFSHLAGTFDADIYNFTSSNAGSLAIASTGANTRTLAFGSGTWTSAGQGNPAISIVATGLTVTGTGTISMTSSASPKTFAGGGVNYSGITLNQGGAGTLTITGNNTFKDITNTYSATGATAIALGATTQTLTNPWTATGAATRVLTVSGTSAASPGTLIFSGAGTAANVDYLNISNVRAYDLVDEWYAGANSTNSGSLGWYFIAAGGNVYAVTITETGTGTDAITASVTLLGTISETGTGTDTVSSSFLFVGAVSETSTITDSNFAAFQPKANITETATGSDVESAILNAISLIAETATGSDADSAKLTANSNLSETATGSDTDSARMTAQSVIAELATITDAASARATLLAAVIEAATITDLSESIKGLFVYILESVTATDSINAPGSTYNPSLSESATATDNIVALTVFVAQIVEATTAADVVAAFKAYFSTVLETASVADLVAAKFTAQSIIAESATGADAETTQLITRPSVIETATGTDADVGRIVFPGNIAESATAADTESAKYTTRPNIAETASGTDASSARATFSSSIIESSTAQDIIQAYLTAVGVITELATGSDQVSALRALAAAIAETASTTDTVAAKAIFRGILQELATAQDAVNAPGSTYSAPVVELATLLDAVLAKATFPVSLNETATGTETVQAIFIPYAQITETATITDAASALAIFAARTVESAYITDQVSPPGSIYNPVVLAVAQMLDQVSPPGSVYNAPVLESATIADSLIGGFLWIDVNDDQVANWNNVNNVQTTTWLAVDDSQTTNWQNVNNTQTSGWTDVNDTQTPGWNPVLP
jgi:fibronectin-binding autotransporter adhesin